MLYNIYYEQYFMLVLFQGQIVNNCNDDRMCFTSHLCSIASVL